MAKAKAIFGSNIGYSTWSFMRTLREAENVARWNPWKAHEWMSEARDMVDFTSPFYDEYDKTVDRINALWKSMERQTWYNQKVFWKKNNVFTPPMQLLHISDDF